MANTFKCECGHMNPVGTSFCENCGKVLEETPALLDMKYEGTARRSISKTVTIIDKIWMFFSSVKIAVIIIIITLLASALGTLYPQEMYIPLNVDPSIYYGDKYGTLGEIYYKLGFHNLYSSWWYILLIASIGISLVICSLDRIVPLYRALKNQRVKKHDTFMKKQRLYSDVEKENVDFTKIQANLSQKNYKVKIENDALFAEKNRFSRWGPYVNHVGLIIFLIGCMFRFLPSMYVDDYIWIREGEKKVIPGTNGVYYLENHEFIMETYKDETNGKVIPKKYQTNTTLYKRIDEPVPGKKPELEKVKDYNVIVNKPLKFDGYALYQTDFKLNELYKMKFKLIEKETEKELGDFEVDLSNPVDEYVLSDRYKLVMEKYLPDFYFDEKGVPSTKTRNANNPVFVFNMIDNVKNKEELVFIGIKQNIEASEDNTMSIKFSNVEFRDASALMVRMDKTIPLLAVGGFIFMVGVIQGLYWNHRRIWLRKTEKGYIIAAHTNKNYFGFKREIDEIVKECDIVAPFDQLNNNKGDSEDVSA